MHKKIWTSLVLAVACGEVAAEPIQMGESSLPITSVEVGDTDSDDAYACEVVETAPRGASDSVISGFVAVTGFPNYGGRCKHSEELGALEQCWYTGPTDCQAGDPEQPCGGFVGRDYDLEAGTFVLEGGQHMLCEYPCVADDQCPAPSSGTARATCMKHPELDPATGTASCMLGCGNGEVCPDGFVCIEPGLGFGQSDGTVWPAPAQCVQYKPVLLEGELL